MDQSLKNLMEFREIVRGSKSIKLELRHLDVASKLIDGLEARNIELEVKVRELTEDRRIFVAECERVEALTASASLNRSKEDAASELQLRGLIVNLRSQLEGLNNSITDLRQENDSLQAELQKERDCLALVAPSFMREEATK